MKAFISYANDDCDMADNLQERLRSYGLDSLVYSTDRTLRLVAQADDFAIFIRCGLLEKVLQAKRGHIRRFKSLDRAAVFVRDLGFTRVELNDSNWQQRQRSL